MKYKPLDRYPYMENDLKDREGYVRNDVFAVYVEQVDAEFRDHNRRISYLEACCEDVPNTYATKAEFNEFKDEAEEILDDHEERITVLEKTTVTQVDFDNTVNDLQRQINNRVTFDIFDDYVEDTNERLDVLEAFADDVPNTYATKAELKEYEEVTDGRLTTLEDFAEEVPTIYATKAELADYEEVTDGRLTTLETFADDVPNTYATKVELNEYKDATDDRLDILEDIADDLPNIYVNKTDFNTYTTATDESITEINHEIDAILLSLDNYVLSTDIATDDKYGIVKTDSEKGITLNEDGQLDINGRLGVTEEGGLYYPTDITPEYVGPKSLMITDATGYAANSSRILALVGGSNIKLKVAAQPGATRFELSNTFANRFIAAAARGGIMGVDGASVKTKTVKILNVYLANDEEKTPLVPYSGATESRNNIIIETAEPLSDTDSLTNIRVYGNMRSDSSLYVGQEIGNGEGSGAVGKNLLLGQGILSTAGNNIVTGNGHYVGKNRCAVFGANHIIDTSGTLAGGLGHDTTNGSDYVVPLGCYSLVEPDTVMAFGDGESNTVRHNIFEIKNVEGHTVIVMVDSEGNNFNLTADTINTLDTRVTALENSGSGGSYYYKNLTVDNGGVGLLFENNGVGRDFHVDSVDFAINNGFVNISVSCRYNAGTSTPGNKQGPRIQHIIPTMLINLVDPSHLNYDSMKLNLIQFWHDISITIMQSGVYGSSFDFNTSYFSEEALDMDAIDAIFNKFRVN